MAAPRPFNLIAIHPSPDLKRIAGPSGVVVGIVPEDIVKEVVAARFFSFDYALKQRRHIKTQLNLEVPLPTTHAAKGNFQRLLPIRDLAKVVVLRQTEFINPPVSIGGLQVGNNIHGVFEGFKKSDGLRVREVQRH